jgi:deoxyribonuclease-4
MSLIGIHINDIKDIKNTLNNKYFNKLNFIQIFVSPSINYLDKSYDKILLCIKKNKINIVVHASYTINLALQWDTHSWWIQQFIIEIEKAEQLNAYAIVIHTGKQLNLSISQSINNMYSALLYIHNATINNEKVKILIETPAGQGTETLTDIQDFCIFINKFYKHPNKSVQKRFGICIDTCHLFVSGHDIRTKKNINKIFNIIDTIVGIDKIKLCHINGAKNNLNEKIDRHSNINDGYIGKKAILTIVKFLNKLEIPMILETPIKYIHKDYMLIKKVNL